MIDLSEDRPASSELARRSIVYGDPTGFSGDQSLEAYPARSTALLRLASGQALPADPARDGLEVLVVEGAVTVDGAPLGQYGFVRRPRSPAPAVTASAEALLFVKRGHIPPDDTVETLLEPRLALWQHEPGSGLPIMPFHRHGSLAVVLRRYQGGAAPVTHRPPGGEEMLVLEGTLLDERSAYPRGSWIRHPPGSLYQPYSIEGCLVYAQSGHLPVM
jgi:hypothetical protein